jgi:hypothetical protein
MGAAWCAGCHRCEVDPSLLATPKLASTDGLDVCKREVLVVVQVVEDLVVRCAKAAVVRGFEASQND